MAIKLFLIATCFILYTEQQNVESTGEITFSIGDVKITRAASGLIEPYSKTNSKIFVDDLITTGSESRCEIYFQASEAKVKLSENSILKTNKQEKSEKDTRSSFSLFFGRMILNVKKLINPTDEFSVRMPTAVAAVRGTEFSLEVDSNQAKVVVNEGSVDCGTVEMLTNFDSFIDFVEKDKELFEKWKQKNSGAAFYENDYKAFKEYQNAELDAYNAYINGTVIKKDTTWVKSIVAGKTLIIKGNVQSESDMSELDAMLFTD
jgi:hypothetical protein